MSQIVNTLPPLPDISSKNYCLCYSVSSSSHTYTLVCFNSLVSNTFDNEGCVYTDYWGGYRVFFYNSGDEEWELYRGTIGSPSEWRISRNNLIASTIDIYDSDGTIFCSATKEEYFQNTVSVISNSITASTLTSALNDTRTLMPILVVALIAFIGLRKAWNFLKGEVRGA